jgi:type IV pilus assembly protein PilC
VITYVYTAKRKDSGETVKAEVQADSEQSAAKLLIAQNLFPITIEQKNGEGVLGKFKLDHIKVKDRVIFTRQLSTLINAGLPLVQSLRTVRSQLDSKPLISVLDQVIASVEGGSTLSEGFAKHPKVFNQVYVSMVRAGEASGTLDKSLERLATQQEKDAAILSKIRSALIYPAIVLAVIIGVLIFMLTTVLPQVAALYDELGKDLPFLTAALVAVSTFITKFWWLTIIMIGLAAFAFINLGKTPAGRAVFDRFKMETPIFGKIMRKVYMARYARTLGTLVGSGIPLLEGLNVVRMAINNVHVEASIAKQISQVKGGKALSASIENDPNFLVLVPQMIAIGERSGALDDMLGRVATFFENEVEEEVKNLSTTIEPVLMVVLGVTVGIVIAAVLLPVYSLVGSGALNSGSTQNIGAPQ